MSEDDCSFLTDRVQGCESSDIFWMVVDSKLMTYSEANNCDLTSLFDAYDRMGHKSDLEGAFEEMELLKGNMPDGYKPRFRRINGNCKKSTN